MVKLSLFIASTIDVANNTKKNSILATAIKFLVIVFFLIRKGIDIKMIINNNEPIGKPIVGLSIWLFYSVVKLFNIDAKINFFH